MKQLFISIFFLSSTAALSFAQSLNDVLSSIEQRSTTLQALRQSTDAEQLGTRSDLGLADPEVGFDYLWGNPSSIGVRKDITITQSFDIATLGGQKRRVAKSQSQVLECQYRAERVALLLNAKQQLIDLTYTNAMLQQMEHRISEAEDMLQAQQQRLDAGDGTLLDFNNARFTHATLAAQQQQLQAERQVLISALTHHNGGEPVIYDATEYPLATLPTDFETWYAQCAANSPLLAEAAADVELSHRMLSLTRSQNLPSLSVGFMSEKTESEHYQGLTTGLSIPLWSNRQKVRQAKASIAAAEARQNDASLQLHTQLWSLYQRAMSLQSSVASFRQALQQADNLPLLRRAMEAGQISLPDYLQQASLYYNAIDQILTAERDYQHALAELTAVEL